MRIQCEIILQQSSSWLIRMVVGPKRATIEGYDNMSSSYILIGMFSRGRVLFAFDFFQIILVEVAQIEPELT